MDLDNEIQVECPTRFRMYKSGRVERFCGTDVVAASFDPVTGVTSKDVVIQPEIGVSARLYLPSLATTNPRAKLPVLVYYHGGGFCIETAFSPTYHNFLNSLVSQANIMAVSVDYRRVPEHLLPAAYDDSLAALRWVASHVRGGPQPWLVEHADFGRVFIAGDSAGANIAHQMALRVGDVGLEHGMEIQGLALVHPYFWGAEPLPGKTRDPVKRWWFETIWKVAVPPEMGVDHPFINPLAEGAPSLEGLLCKKVLVWVAENDLLSVRGRAYYEALKRSGYGGEAELMESKGEGHVFHLFKPNCDEAQL